MTRIFMEEEIQDKDTVLLTGSQRRYLCTVLRIRPGEEVIVFDRSGWEYTARFVSADRRWARLAIVGKQTAKTESALELILAQALLKAEKMEMVIQKAVELGASAIYPFTCDRVISRHSSHPDVPRLERWKRIVLEASQQCGRTRILQVGRTFSFEEILAKRTSVDIGMVFSSQGQVRFGQSAHEMQSPRSVLVLVGPEGGFTDQEVAMAIEQGFVSVSLGPRTLRAETAGILAVGLMQHRFGDMA